MPDKTDKTTTDTPDRHQNSSEPSPPMVSVKTIGSAARKFDETMTKAIGVGVGGGFKLVSERLKRTLHSGHWQNYAFIVFAAVIFAAAALVIIMTFFWR